MRPNCWEYMRCGREPGGRNARELGICSATLDKSADGINRGKNAGRICWAVVGTFCDGEEPGCFVDKQDTCMECPFYKLVRKEEGANGHSLLKPGQVYEPQL